MNVLKSIIPFLIVFAIHLLGVLCNWDNVVFYTKPLLLISLICYFIGNVKFSLIILCALFFSLLGDVLLMFQNSNSMFFILGLVAFLVAHIFYVVYFIGVKKLSGNAKWNVFIVLGAIAYGVSLVTILYPKLGSMKMPVIIYATTICTMLITAKHTWLAYKNMPTLFFGIGAGLFVLSDSLLAFNKFYSPFAAASFLIMLTYGLAQMFIVMGVIKFYPNKG